MAGLVDDALAAGAFGYSISRSLTHHTPDGRWVPGTWSDPSEFAAIAAPLGRRGQGVLECAPRYNEVDGSTSRVDEEMAWIAELSRTLGRPFTFNLMQMASLGDHYRRVLELAVRGQRNRGIAAPPDHPAKHRGAVQPRGQHPRRRPAVVPAADGTATSPAGWRASAIPRSGPRLIAGRLGQAGGRPSSACS